MIYAITVTYGDRFSLLKQVVDSAFQEGVEKIIIVDNNSSPENRIKIRQYENKYNSKIKVIYLSENTGSSGGFHAGLQEISASKCEFVLLLDDDNILSKNSIKRLINYYKFFSQKEKNLVLSFNREYGYIDDLLMGENNVLKKNFYRGFNLWSLLVKRLKLKKVNQRKKARYACIDVAPYSGLFFKREVLESIGFPDKNFYLYADDFEYTYRISRKFKIILIEKIKVIDLEYSWNNFAKSGLFYHPFINDGSNFKTYYLFRNADYLETAVFRKRGPVFIFNKYVYLSILLFIGLINLRFSRIKIILKALNDSRDLNDGYKN